MANGNPTVTAVNPVVSAPAAPPQNKAKQPTVAELQAQLLKLQAENAALQAGNNVITFMTSHKADANSPTGWVKGGMIAYGFMRFPVTLGEKQWRKLISLVKDGTVEKCLEQHIAGTLPIKYVDPEEYKARKAAGK